VTVVHPDWSERDVVCTDEPIPSRVADQQGRRAEVIYPAVESDSPGFDGVIPRQELELASQDIGLRAKGDPCLALCLRLATPQVQNRLIWSPRLGRGHLAAAREHP
jgi:hypothetical protein